MIATTELPQRPVSVVGPKRDYISYSAITTYQQCPLRYRFRYVDGLPENVVSSSLVFGPAVHCAVEFHFSELLVGNEPPSQDLLLDVFQDSWQARSAEHEQIRFGKGEDHSSLSSLADRMLQAFRMSPSAATDETVIGIEEELRGELVPGIPDLLARIDLLTVSGDQLTVVDLKTSRSKWSQEQAENSSDQLLLYSELARRMMPDKEVKLRFIVATKTKSPAIESFDVAAGNRRLRRTIKAVEHTWRAIETGNFFPTPNAMICPACPYRDDCRAWCG